jgi:hypothetical protein
MQHGMQLQLLVLLRWLLRGPRSVVGCMGAWGMALLRTVRGRRGVGAGAGELVSLPVCHRVCVPPPRSPH